MSNPVSKALGVEVDHSRTITVISTQDTDNRPIVIQIQPLVAGDQSMLFQKMSDTIGFPINVQQMEFVLTPARGVPGVWVPCDNGTIYRPGGIPVKGAKA